MQNVPADVISAMGSWLAAQLKPELDSMRERLIIAGNLECWMLSTRLLST